MEFKHISVLLNESVDALGIKKDGIYADGTLGGGGHSEKILEKLSGKGLLIGIDRDIEAICAAKERLKNYTNVIYENTNFKNIKEILAKNKIDGINGAVLDLGVSSYQLDNAERGFGYTSDARLDMRMDTSAPLDAYCVVNTYSEEELAKIFFEYGEERFSRKIAAEIVKRRSERPIETTGELSGLSEAICDFFDCLKCGGRLSVISFHSLEDRIVKNTFASLAKGCICPKDFPVCVCGRKPLGKIITRKAIIPSEGEIETNRRSKSAKLRVIEKL